MNLSLEFMHTCRNNLTDSVSLSVLRRSASLALEINRLVEPFAGDGNRKVGLEGEQQERI